MLKAVCRSERSLFAVRWELQVSVSTRLCGGRTCTLPLRVVPPEFLASDAD